MTDRMWARGFGEAVTATGPFTRRVEWSITGSVSTPLPADLRPASVLDLGTGRLAPTKDLGEVIRSAGNHIAAVAAVLPTTEAGNALVDELLRTGTRGIGARTPLTRRTK